MSESIADPLFELLERIASDGSALKDTSSRESVLRPLAVMADRFGEIAKVLEHLGDGLVLLSELIWSVEHGEDEPEEAMDSARQIFDAIKEIDLPEECWKLIDAW